jgi:hypothetical protein
VHYIRIDGTAGLCRDRTNNRLQIFRKDGTFVAEHIYEEATRGTGSITRPRVLARQERNSST